MPRPPRPLLPKTCLVCGQTWAPRDSRQARERQTCSAACAKRQSGQSRVGQRRPHKSNPVGRTCTRCGEFKGWGQFAWTVRGRRRGAWCRSCVSAYNRAYRAQYRDSLNAEKRRRHVQWQRTARGAVYWRWYKTFARHDRQIARARRAAQLTGAYFRGYLRMADEWEKPLVWAYAQHILRWLYRSHCWMSDEQIAAALGTEPHTVRWSIGLVRAAIRTKAFDPLAAHAQEVLRQCEEAVRHEAGGEGSHEPTELALYRKLRRAQDERARRFG